MEIRTVKDTTAKQLLKQISLWKTVLKMDKDPVPLQHTLRTMVQPSAEIGNIATAMITLIWLLPLRFLEHCSVLPSVLVPTSSVIVFDLQKSIAARTHMSCSLRNEDSVVLYCNLLFPNKWRNIQRDW